MNNHFYVDKTCYIYNLIKEIVPKHWFRIIWIVFWFLCSIIFSAFYYLSPFIYSHHFVCFLLYISPLRAQAAQIIAVLYSFQNKVVHGKCEVKPCVSLINIENISINFFCAFFLKENERVYQSAGVALKK